MDADFAAIVETEFNKMICSVAAEPAMKGD
jgi:hypothetical protein